MNEAFEKFWSSTDANFPCGRGNEAIAKYAWQACAREIAQRLRERAQRLLTEAAKQFNLTSEVCSKVEELLFQAQEIERDFGGATPQEGEHK